MRAIAFILFLVIIVVAFLLIMALLQRRAETKRKKASKWYVSPRTNESNAEEIWLLCEGEPAFLFWPTERNKQWDWDRALMEADVQVMDFNRQRRELNK